METKGGTVRVSENTKAIINKLYSYTDVPKGKILFDAVRILEQELEKYDYNYSKIVEKYPR